LDSLLCLGLKLDIQFGGTSFKCRKWEYWMQLYIKARSRSDHWIWSLRAFCKALLLLYKRIGGNCFIEMREGRDGWMMVKWKQISQQSRLIHSPHNLHNLNRPQVNVSS
jgi:hypothetical protein